jgi:cytochrome P450 family 135
MNPTAFGRARSLPSSPVAIPGPSLQALTSARYFLGWFSFLEQCQRRYGDVFRLRLPFFGSVVVISDPDAIRTVDKEALAARSRTPRAVGDLLGEGTLILVEGELHRRRRRLLTPPFYGEHLAAYEPMVAEAVELYTSRWSHDQLVSIARFAPRLTLDVIARVLYGISDPRASARFSALARQLMADWAFTTMLPDRAKVESYPGPWRRFARTRRAFHELIQAQINEHRRTGDGTPKTDVCALLMSATDEDGETLTDAEIRDELLLLSLAGNHTTAISIAWAFDLITHDAATLARVEDCPDDTAFCEAIVRETLRLRPPIDGAIRTLPSDVELCGVTVHAGEVIFPASHLVHHRADMYERPDEFRPERFLNGAAPSYAWLAFGGGARRCIGAGLAQLEMRLAIQGTFARWRVRAARPRPARARRSCAFFWVPAGGVRVRLARR